MTRTTLETTTNYYQINPGVRLLRMFLGAVQLFGTNFAGRVANRVFCSPLPSKRLYRRTRWDDNWRIEHWPFERDSVTVYLPAGKSDANAPLALLVHGWGGHAAQMLPIAQTLMQQGMRTVLLELPAHGRSDGAISNLAQFSRAIEYAARRLLENRAPGQEYRLQLLVGHSLGASASAAAVSRGLPVERLVMLAPAASPLQYTHLFARVFGLKEATRLAMQKHLEAREGIVMRQFEPPTVGPRIHAQTLVVHDHDDAVNPFADGLSFARAIPAARLIDTQGLGHRKLLKEPEVIEQIGSFAAR